MRFGAAGAARAAQQRRRSGRRPLKPPGGRLGCARCLRFAGGAGGLAGSCKGPAGPPARRAGTARAAGRPRRSRGARRAVWAAGCGVFFAGGCKGRGGRRRSGRRPLKPPGGRLGCARCLRFAGGCGADAKPRGRPVRRGTDTSFLSPQIQPGKEPLWQTGKSN